MRARRARGASAAAPVDEPGGLSAWMPATGPIVRRFSLPFGAAPSDSLRERVIVAPASPPFEERVASRDQRRPFSHHLQPQALETPSEIPQGAVTLAPQSRLAVIQAGRTPATLTRCAPTGTSSSCAAVAGPRTPQLREDPGPGFCDSGYASAQDDANVDALDWWARGIPSRTLKETLAPARTPAKNAVPIAIPAESGL